MKIFNNQKGSLLGAFLSVFVLGAFAQSECPDYSIYLSNNPPGTNSSTIYKIDLDDDAGIAEMTALKTVDYFAHLAFNEMDGLLYVINANNGAYQTLDASVVDGALGEVTATIPAVPNAIAATFSAEGKLVLGSGADKKIYSVDPGTSERMLFAEADVEGGDLAFDEAQNLYMATRSGGRLKLIIPGFSNMVLANIPNLVNGMARLSNDDLILAVNGNSSLITRATDGSETGVSYTLSLNGEPFTLANGDMASGCTAFQPVVEPCPNHKLFYANHPSADADATSTVYSVGIEGSDANLTSLIELDYTTHLAYNEMSNILYFVSEDDGFVDIFDVGTETLEADLRIMLNPAPSSKLTAAVYNPADGLLYIGFGNQIRAVDLSDGTHTLVANAPVSGGDLTLLNGALYLASSTGGGKLFLISGGGATELGNLPGNQVNGMALTAENQLFIAGFGTTAFRQIDLEGNEEQSFDAKMDGAPFNIGYGDLASGCFEGDDDDNPGACENLVTYLYNFAGGANSGQLFSVSFSGNEATYTQIAGISPADQHIAIDASGLIYATRGNKIDIFDPIAEAYVEQNIPIKTPGGQSLSGFPAAVIDGAGTLWIAGAGNKVYTVEFIGGEAIATEQFGPADGISVSGGDLVVTESAEGGEILWLANRSQLLLYNLTEGGSIDLPLPQVKGVSVAGDGQSLILADGQTDENGGLYLWNPVSNELSQYSNVGGPANFFWGDLAGRCQDINLEGCPDYQVYYTGYPQSNSTTTNGNQLFRVSVENGQATFTLVNGFSAADNHIAISSEGLIYSVSVARTTLDIFNPATESYVQQNIPIKTALGQSLTGFPAAAMDSNDKLWIAVSSTNTVYSVEIIDGEAIATPEFTGTPIDGGDLIFTIGENGEDVLWHINRVQNTLYNFNDGSSTPIDLPEINGAAVLEDGRLVFANGENNANGGLWAYDVATATLEQLTSNGGPSLFANGDMAGGCVSSEAAPAPSPTFGLQPASQSATAGQTIIRTSPNPTSGVTFIDFAVAQEGRTVIDVIDLNGRQVAQVFNQEALAGNNYRVQFDAAQLPVGIYIVRMVSNDKMEISKIMVNR